MFRRGRGCHCHRLSPWLHVPDSSLLETAKLPQTIALWKLLNLCFLYNCGTSMEYFFAIGREVQAFDRKVAKFNVIRGAMELYEICVKELVEEYMFWKSWVLETCDLHQFNAKWWHMLLISLKASPWKMKAAEIPVRHHYSNEVILATRNVFAGRSGTFLPHYFWCCLCNLW